MARFPRRLAPVVALALLAACSPDGPDVEPLSGSRPSAVPGPVPTSAAVTTPPAPTTTAAPTTTTTVAPSTTAATTTTTVPAVPMPTQATLQGVKVATAPYLDLPELTGFAWAEGDSEPYVIDQRGRVYRTVGGQPEVVLDLTSEVSEVLAGSERGLLGIAFDPVDGRMFLDFTDKAGHTHVVSYAMRDGRPDPASRWELLFQEQPGPGHNGGHLAFDRAGHLFIGLGDGGGSKGRDAQDMSKLLGAILRVEPKRNGPGYTVPSDNPFVGQEGVRPEIWVKGLRNPWRFSIDHATGDLWLGDVGNDQVEEVDRVPAGQKGLNFGWYFFEGSRQRFNDVPPGMVPPVFEYTHDVGAAVIGGYVYRGKAIPGLAGAYVFADLSGIVWAMGTDGVVRLPVQVGGAVTSFGEGPDGELYVLTLRKGAVRLVPA